MRDQIVRLATLFGLAILLLVLARHFLTPKTFGDLGHYRAAAVDAIAAHKIKYAGRQVCGDCHEEVVNTHGRKLHREVACEVCHGPAAAHAEDPTGVRPAISRERELCQLCHAYDPARPTGFPQIDPAAHNPLRPCIGCHHPHDPEPSRTPEECSGCHGQIARAKAVSHHGLLACTKCHETPKEHKITPRTVVPGKPTTRAFCGKCHAPDAVPPPDIVQSVRRIDIASHYPRYVCWQCHYPHFPELK